MALPERTAWLRLALTEGIGNDTARRLLAAFGPPEAVFSQAPTALRQLVSAAQTQALLSEPAPLAAQVALTEAWLAGAEPGVPRQLLALDNPAYPAALLHTADPPLMLYTQGSVAVAEIGPALAIVGSRNPTPQGAANAQAFASALAQAGLTVVSGLALGIDGAAHSGALAVGGATVAVVGTGLDRVYPRQHRELAHRITRCGLLVSEFPLGTPPLAHHFPRRNRIIAGLSQGTLVVEAALASGSLITAKQALEQGREVFAIPGSIHSPQSRGCHALIRQGAKLVESAQDVLEELPLFTGKAMRPALEPASADAENPLLAALGHDPVSLDALQARTGLPTAQLQAGLLTLELDGLVARLPGGLFQRQAQG